MTGSLGSPNSAESQRGWGPSRVVWALSTGGVSSPSAAPIRMAKRRRISPAVGSVDRKIWERVCSPQAPNAAALASHELSASGPAPILSSPTPLGLDVLSGWTYQIPLAPRVLDMLPARLPLTGSGIAEVEVKSLPIVAHL